MPNGGGEINLKKITDNMILLPKIHKTIKI